ncbi:MAG: dTDP-4-dehydrorhamnose reductase [Zetaproteobacteria bacterium]|nr:MAG: dTDP-4-dehydrorhamnose reductase [Zetaproteobacteria bacterium]
MRLLITGAGGQLGRALVRQGAAHQLQALGRDALDITDRAAVDRAMAAFTPDVVINAAAWTDVDRAEAEAERAFAVNRDGAANLAAACADHGAVLIHISTDYVFDGSADRPWREEDPPAPLNTYGASKLAGEEAVRAILERHYIVRTSWLISGYGRNFATTILRLGMEREHLSVVDDQTGAPTTTEALARALLRMIDRRGADWGTYHFCQPEPTSWFGLACALFEAARAQGAPPLARLQPISSAEYPTPARRPSWSVLDCSKFRRTIDDVIPPWRAGLAEIVAAMDLSSWVR